jgi:hypothetical protein
MKWIGNTPLRRSTKVYALLDASGMERLVGNGFLFLYTANKDKDNPRKLLLLM